MFLKKHILKILKSLYTCKYTSVRHWMFLTFIITLQNVKILNGFWTKAIFPKHVHKKPKYETFGAIPRWPKGLTSCLQKPVYDNHDNVGTVPRWLKWLISIKLEYGTIRSFQDGRRASLPFNAWKWLFLTKLLTFLFSLSKYFQGPLPEFENIFKAHSLKDKIFSAPPHLRLRTPPRS